MTMDTFNLYVEKKAITLYKVLSLQSGIILPKPSAQKNRGPVKLTFRILILFSFTIPNYFQNHDMSADKCNF